jgi:hypothetical protein
MHARIDEELAIIEEDEMRKVGACVMHMCRYVCICVCMCISQRAARCSMHNAHVFASMYAYVCVCMSQRVAYS